MEKKSWHLAVEINRADKRPLNTWVIYLLPVLARLLIPAKIPQRPAPIWRQDGHLPWQLRSEVSNTCSRLCPNSNYAEENTWEVPPRALSGGAASYNGLSAICNRSLTTM